MNAEPRIATAINLAAKVAALRDPSTYPVPPGQIDTVETHMSWVFLTERYAYKMKKPVRYDFLDFRTLEARQGYCLAENTLNAVLAPGVYLGVAPLVADARGRLQLETSGDVVEYLVKMRRLLAGRMLDRLLTTGGVRTEELQQIAGILAHFYRDSQPTDMRAETYCTHYQQQVLLNRSVLADATFGLGAEIVAHVCNFLLEYIQRSCSRLIARAQDGKIIDGHGDLRPEHICLDSKPVIFDRLEFNRRLRLVDPLDELASLAMECDGLGAPHVGKILFSTYVEVTQDMAPEDLILFYKAHRACLRARLAILHTHELAPAAWAPWRERALAYLSRAAGYVNVLTASSLLE